MCEDTDRDSNEDEGLKWPEPPQKDEWGEQIGQKALRKIRARESRRNCVWFGLGAFGVVGWSVSIPTLLGILLGQWIDRTWPSQFSWTLMLLVAGVAGGCANAWYWINREFKQTQCGVDDETEHSEGDDEAHE